MLQWPVLALSVLFQASVTLPDAYDVTTLTVGAPVAVADLDLGRLKGDLRQIGWSPDSKQIYVQTAEGNPKSPKLHHFVVGVADGVVTPLDKQPDWAEEYWAFKSDRLAPGLEWITIDVEQKVENLKFGTGSAGAADRASGGLTGENAFGASASNVEKAAESQHVNVVRFKVFDQTVSEFVNEQPLPGLMFGWGPEKSGAIAFTDRDGRLTLADQRKHKRNVAGAKDAQLPAWTPDGARLAWVQKTGRKRAALVYATVGR
jgi:hypothetical protein